MKRVGHAGTLDPFAEGVLIVGIGRSATKHLAEYQMMEKEYVGTVVLGIITDTYDPTGTIIETRDFLLPTEEKILEVLAEFCGEIEQLPPAYSAVKVNGMRMYKAARKGIELDRKPRRVHVKSLDLVRLLENGFEMKVVCSKGTYIRALAYDIGQVLGTGAHLGSLTRTRIGKFELGESMSLDEFVELGGNNPDRGI